MSIDSVHSKMERIWSTLKFHLEGKSITSLLEMLIDEKYIHCTSFDSVFSPAREGQVSETHQLISISIQFDSKWTKVAQSFILFRQASLSRIKGNIYIWTHKDYRKQGKKTPKTPTKYRTTSSKYSTINQEWHSLMDLKFNINYTVNQVP